MGSVNAGVRAAGLIVLTGVPGWEERVTAA